MSVEPLKSLLLRATLRGDVFYQAVPLAWRRVCRGGRVCSRRDTGSRRKRRERHRRHLAGSSVCTDRAAAPACTDGQVVYEIDATPGKPNAVTVKADKVVDGERIPMAVVRKMELQKER